MALPVIGAFVPQSNDPLYPTRAVQLPPTEHAATLSAMTEASMERKLDAFGTHWVLDMMAGGVLLEEIAISLQVRVQVLKAWLRRNTTEDSIIEARKHAASVYRGRALREIENNIPADRTALGYLKLKTDAYRDMSQAMDPGTWAPDTRNAQQLGVANVVINMDPFALNSIPGNNAQQPNQTIDAQPVPQPAPPVEGPPTAAVPPAPTAPTAPQVQSGMSEVLAMLAGMSPVSAEPAQGYSPGQGQLAPSDTGREPRVNNLVPPKPAGLTQYPSAVPPAIIVGDE